MDDEFECLLTKFSTKVNQGKNMRDALKKIQSDTQAMQLELDEFFVDMNILNKSFSDYLQEQNNKKTSAPAFPPVEAEIIKLNIGGKLFSTFKATICKKILKSRSGHEFHPPNWLDNIVNGRLEAKRDEDGCIFVDRSPKYFDYVLNYLRLANTSQELELPKNKSFLKDLINEARFYEMDGLKYFVKEFYNCIANSHMQSKEHNSFESGNELAVNRSLNNSSNPNTSQKSRVQNTSQPSHFLKEENADNMSKK